MGTVIKNSSHKTKTGLISNKDAAKRFKRTGSYSDKVVRDIDAAAKAAGTFNSGTQGSGTTVGAPEGYAMNTVTGKLEKLAGVPSNWNPATSGNREDPVANATINRAVQTTDTLRADEVATKNNAAGLMKLLASTNMDMDEVLKSYLTMDTFGETEKGKKAEDKLTDLFDNVDRISRDQQRQIDQEGEMAGREFDPIISEAERNKQQGMAKNIVGAGEAGGFMNTQYAGIGALLPTEGGDFVGTGGELNRLKSEYDAQISNLQSQRVIAIAKAKAAAKEAILTGNRQLLNDAMSYYNFSKQAYNDTLDAIEGKINLVNTYNQQQKNDAQQNLQFMLSTFGAGAFDDNIDALKTAAAQAGYDPDLFAKGIKTLKEQKQLGELRSVGGNLYNITYDSKGNPVAKLVVGGGGGGNNTVSTGGQFTQAQLMSPEIQDYVNRVERGDITLQSVPTSTDAKKNKREMVRQVLEQRQSSIKQTGIDNAPTRSSNMDYNQTRVIEATNEAIRSNIGGDGYVNPAAYMSARSDIVKDYPELLSWFDSTYPKSKYISPRELELMSRT